MGARGGAMIVPVRPVAKSRCPSTSRSSHLSTGPSPNRSSALALEVFRHQFETIAPYRRYCEARGVEPDAVRSVDDIPAVSNVAFKYADLASEGASRLPDAAVFLTSGTTQGRDRRGRHIVARPEIYRASAIAHLRTMLFPDARRMPILAMHPTADVMPESSLSAMISWSIEEFGTGTASGGSVARAGRCSGGDRVSWRLRGASRAGLHHGDDGGLCGAVFRAARSTDRKLRLAAGIANDGHGRREGAGGADAGRRR